MKVGIAGVDENKRIIQAQTGLGIAGEVKGQVTAGALTGLNSWADKMVVPDNGSMGIAGNFGSATRQQVTHEIVDIGAFMQRDHALANISKHSSRLGDVAARTAWRHALWFLDFTYITKRVNGRVVWREGREVVFSPAQRLLPLFIDSGAYRRMVGTAPQWARAFDIYPEVIELTQPDGYPTWDDPESRANSMGGLRRLVSIFPNDVTSGRMWPVYSVRWSWDDTAHLASAKVPAWVGENMVKWIPFNETQRQYKASTLESWARQAIANALIAAEDPDFRWMVRTFGKIMLGGMVRGPIPRVVRHLYAATLCAIFPDAQFWLLGQANFATVNGLGIMDLLSRVFCDGTWWLNDSRSERISYIKNGLITMHSFEAPSPRVEAGQSWQKRTKNRQSFFSLVELMAANLRALLGAYEGLWAWPPPEPLPIDLCDLDQVAELRWRYQLAAKELNLLPQTGPGGS